MQYLLKIILSALIIFGVSELGKRFTPFAAILASLPIISIMAIIGLYADTKDISRIIGLSYSIFWAVLPSLIFFLILPLLLKNGISFSISLIISMLCMFLIYSIYIYIMPKLGIRL